MLFPDGQAGPRMGWCMGCMGGGGGDDVVEGGGVTIWESLSLGDPG